MPSALAENVPATSSDSLSLPPAARIVSPCGGGLDDRVLDPLPVDADALDAEIVLGADLEVELLGVEHDLLPGQVLARERRRLVVAAGDGRAMNGSLPASPNASSQRNSILREPSTAIGGLGDGRARRACAGLPSTLADGEVAAGGGGEAWPGSP